MLATDPRTPSAIAPFLSTFATLLPALIDENHIARVQECYMHALGLRNPEPAPQPPFLPLASHPPNIYSYPMPYPTPQGPPHHQSHQYASYTPPPYAQAISYIPPNSPLPPGAILHTRGSARFVDYGGRMYYWAASSGMLTDIAFPPQKPCRVCHAQHWSWQCPMLTGPRIVPPPITTAPFQNSPYGGGSAVVPSSV